MHKVIAVLSTALFAAAMAHAAGAEIVARSPVPLARPGSSARMPVNQGFQRWIASFRTIALRRGISPRTFDAAFRGVQLNPVVLSREANQSEFVTPIWDYLASAVSEQRIQTGREMMAHYSDLLDRIQARYGVDKRVVVAIWGIESAYGAHRGSFPLVEALATLAYEGNRRSFFETQLIDALKILQHGDVAPAQMTGSWAGAMGHTQFMPSSYLAYAVDFTGDGKRDIWSNNPADALASTAAYLAKMGWHAGQPWGLEVTLPRGFDYAQTGHQVSRSPAEWARLGVRPAHGARLPEAGPGHLLLPAGANGAAFLIFHNFDVIGRYNAADAYVLAVGLLADRIGGAAPLVGAWPSNGRGLTFDERVELQTRLTAAGFNTEGTDGMIGPKTIAALRAFQRSVGMVPDGYASLDVLRRLR